MGGARAKRGRDVFMPQAFPKPSKPVLDTPELN
jgi:hypothetical protein